MIPTLLETQTAIGHYLTALGADRYHLRLVNFAMEKSIPVTYTAEQFGKPGTAGYLRKMNYEGFNIYARPVGWQYVLLDDLTRPVLADLATLNPCALVETSPANYQAWLILGDVPPDRDTAKAICRELAQRFGADPAAADPDHVGRVPSFQNLKEKYYQADGRYPVVKLHRWEHRVSTFTPQGGLC